MIQSLWSGCKALLFPPYCYACHNLLEADSSLLCRSCQDNFEQDRAWVAYTSQYAKERLLGRLPCRSVFSFWKFRDHHPVQQVLHALKYEGQQLLGLKLGAYMGATLAQQGRKWDYIIPVPLHKKKLQARGYNQAAWLAKGIATKIKGAKVKEGWLVRRQYGGSQTKLSREARIQQVRQAFCLEPHHQLKGRSILLVDDVLTTGATLVACGRSLLKGKVKRLAIATAAIAL